MKCISTPSIASCIDMAGASWLRVRVIPRRTSKNKTRFKKNYQQGVQVALSTREATDKRPVLQMAEDEGCFGRLSIPRRAWARPGMRPHAPQQLIREYTYVYAAVAPAEGKIAILPSADTEMMNFFLEHVSKTYEKYFVVMQVDQASWHGAKDLRIPANIRLIAQPAYSPELNPVEHIWKELREKQLANFWLFIT